MNWIYRAIWDSHNISKHQYLYEVHIAHMSSKYQCPCNCQFKFIDKIIFLFGSCVDRMKKVFIKSSIAYFISSAKLILKLTCAIFLANLLTAHLTVFQHNEKIIILFIHPFFYIPFNLCYIGQEIFVNVTKLVIFSYEDLFSFVNTKRHLVELLNSIILHFSCYLQCQRKLKYSFMVY